MRVSGSVYVRRHRRGAKTGPLWYAKWRVEGKQFKRRIGPAWKGRGSPPDGYYREREARQLLEGILTDARRGLDVQRSRRKSSGRTRCRRW